MLAVFGQLRLAILAILRLHPCGLVILAPVCSGFSYMCSSQAQRHWLNPEGNTDLPWVRAGNIMANRVTLLCWLCSALGHSWVIEQPSSKKFGDLPRWRFFCENVIFATWMQIHNFQIFAKMYTIYRGELVLKFDGASCVLWPSCYIPPPKVRVWLKTLPQGFSSADMDATFWLWIVETNMLVVQFCGSEMLQPWPTECKTKGWSSSLGSHIRWFAREEKMCRKKGTVEEQPAPSAGFGTVLFRYEASFGTNGDLYCYNCCVCAFCFS